MKIKIVTIGILLLLINVNISSQSINYEVIGFTYHGSCNENIDIISDDNDFSNKWKRGIDLVKAITPVDFDKECLIIVSRGQCSSGGYSIKVDSIYIEENNLITECSYLNPGENCRRTMSLTCPAILIRIKNKDLPLVLRKSTVIKDCK